MSLRPLRSYQKNAFYYCSSVQHPALLMDMRTGKTVVTVRHLRSKMRFPALIVAPYSALFSWEDEFHQEGVPDSDLRWLTGSRADRIGALKRVEQYNLINREGFLSLPEIADYPWRSVVCDESTFLKNPKAKVSRFFTQNFRRVPNRYILTGTPAPESPLDIVQQLLFLDPQILQVRHYWEFRHRWCYQPFNDPYKWDLTPDGRAFLGARMSAYCFSLTRQQAGVEVRKIFVRRLVELPPAARRNYHQVQREFRLKLQSEERATIFATTSWLWLRRICGGVYNGTTFQTAKVEELLSILKGELSHVQVVVWAVYLEEIDMLVRVLNREDITVARIDGRTSPSARRFVYDNFRRGIIRVLVAEPECFKHGTNLSCADTAIYYSLPVGLETWQQSQDRTVNLSTGAAVMVMCLLMRGTIEEDIYATLLDKGDKQELLRRLMRRMDEVSGFV